MPKLATQKKCMKSPIPTPSPTLEKKSPVTTGQKCVHSAFISARVPHQGACFMWQHKAKLDWEWMRRTVTRPHSLINRSAPGGRLRLSSPECSAVSSLLATGLLHLYHWLHWTLFQPLAEPGTQGCKTLSLSFMRMWTIPPCVYSRRQQRDSVSPTGFLFVHCTRAWSYTRHTACVHVCDSVLHHIAHSGDRPNMWSGASLTSP